MFEASFDAKVRSDRIGLDQDQIVFPPILVHLNSTSMTYYVVGKSARSSNTPRCVVRARCVSTRAFAVAFASSELSPLPEPHGWARHGVYYGEPWNLCYNSFSIGMTNRVTLLRGVLVAIAVLAVCPALIMSTGSSRRKTARAQNRRLEPDRSAPTVSIMTLIYSPE